MKNIYYKTGMVLCTAAVLIAFLIGCSSAAPKSAGTTAPAATTASETAGSAQAATGAPSNGNQGMPPGGPPPGGSASVDTGTGAYVLADNETLKGGTYPSNNADENAIRAEGDITASLDEVTVEKNSGAASSNGREQLLWT